MHGDYKVSHFSSFVDVGNDNGDKRGRFIDYNAEFVDAHSTLVELDNDRANLLSQNHNFVGIGLAFDEEHVTVVDIFSTKNSVIDSVDINTELSSIVVEGRILNGNLGPFALRIIQGDNMNKKILEISPQNINYDIKAKIFRANFNNCGKVTEDPSHKFIEVFLRAKPETIRYGLAYTDKINYSDIILGSRVSLESFPHIQLIREREQEEELEQQKRNQDDRYRMEERLKEREERERRMARTDGFEA